MKTVVKSFICGVAFFAGLAVASHTYDELSIFTQGMIVSGLISGNGNGTNAAGLEVQGNNDVGLSLYRKGASNTTDENFLAFFAKNNAGSPQKVFSLSSSWRDNDSQNGFNWVRYNATYFVNGVGYDDLSIQQFGGKGITLCGTGGIPPAGIKLYNDCIGESARLQRFDDGIALSNWSPGSEPIYGYARIRLSEGMLKVILSDGTVKTVAYQ